MLLLYNIPQRTFMTVLQNQNKISEPQNVEKIHKTYQREGENYLPF